VCVLAGCPSDQGKDGILRSGEYEGKIRKFALKIWNFPEKNELN